MLEFDEQKTLPHIHVPLLVIAGINDRVTVIDVNRDIAARIEHGEFVPLDPGGHLSLMERYNDVAAAIAGHTSELLQQPLPAAAVPVHPQAVKRQH